MRTIGKLIIAGVFVFAILQLVRPSIPVKQAAAELQVPPDIKNVLEKDCYSCHSDQVAYSGHNVPSPNPQCVCNAKTACNEGGLERPLGLVFIREKDPENPARVRMDEPESIVVLAAVYSRVPTTT